MVADRNRAAAENVDAFEEPVAVNIPACRRDIEAAKSSIRFKLSKVGEHHRVQRVVRAVDAQSLDVTGVFASVSFVGHHEERTAGAWNRDDRIRLIHAKYGPVTQADNAALVARVQRIV